LKIGFLTACFPEKKFEDIVKWGASNSFQQIEVPCWPSQWAVEREYAGISHIDVDSLDEVSVKKIKTTLENNQISISSLGFYTNFLDPDNTKREFNISHLKKVIIGAKKLGVGIVGTWIGKDKDKDDNYNLKQFKEIFSDIVKFAEKNNIKLAIENSPLISEFRPGGENIARSPEIWFQMFNLIQSDYIGLNLDPSHLVWQFIDYVKAVASFKGKIFHTHAKDTKILYDKLAETGIYGWGPYGPTNFYQDKLAGMGDIDWKKYIRALYEIEYDGVISIEHEDRGWEKSEENIKQGVLLAKRFLSFYVA
jgi:sugar phosphate isomerase/epimerase